MQPNYRRCVSCRTISHRQELLRVVRIHSTGIVQFKTGMGRSAYLCPQVHCLNLAYKKNRLGRALKVPIPDGIYRELHQYLEQPVNLLGKYQPFFKC